MDDLNRSDPLTGSLDGEGDAVFDWSSFQPKTRATLCFVRQDRRILMIRKKRGLGAGKINGVGGKLDAGETALDCVVREAHEELGINLLDPQSRGELHFQFIDGYSLFCTVFLATQYTGIPSETAEAVPLWFEVDQLPFHEMWQDDQLWLPQVLEGQVVRGFFLFDNDNLLSHQIEWLI